VIRLLLRTASKVLGECRYRNAVSTIILLSDDRDNYSMLRRHVQRRAVYEVLVPPSFVPDSGIASEGSAPIHTFGWATTMMRRRCKSL